MAPTDRPSEDGAPAAAHADAAYDDDGDAPLADVDDDD
jgi:hypothetical protein